MDFGFKLHLGRIEIHIGYREGFSILRVVIFTLYHKKLWLVAVSVPMIVSLD